MLHSVAHRAARLSIDGRSRGVMPMRINDVFSQFFKPRGWRSAKSVKKNLLFIATPEAFVT